MSKFAIAMAMYSAERKLIDATYKFFKRAWEHARRFEEPRDAIDEYEQRVFDALIVAFFWGQVDAWAKVRKAENKMRFADFDRHHIIAVIKNTLKQHPEILIAFARRVVSEEEMFSTIFRPPQTALDFVRDYTVKLAHVESQAVLKSVTQAVEHTIQKGMSERDAEKYIQDKFQEFKEKRVKAIARTEATRAYNMGLIARSMNIVKGYRFSAVLDAKTTQICQERHGKFIPADDTVLLAYNTPPLHVNCRSSLIPEFEQTSEALDMAKVTPPQKRDVDIEDFVQFLRRLR